VSVDEHPPPPTDVDAPPDLPKTNGRHGRVASLDDVRRQRNVGARTPPHDLASEAALLGACLITKHGRAVDQALEAGVLASDFYRAGHGHIWTAVLALHQRGEPADPVTVANELHAGDLLAGIGGPATLIELMNATPATSNAPKYAKNIVDHARMRGWIQVAADIADLGYSRLDDVDTLDQLIDNRIARLRDDRPINTTSPWAPQSLAAVWDQPVLEQPFILRRSDDAALLYMARINTVAGPPESGKSWLAYLACAQLAVNGQHCAYIDLEDRADGAASRLAKLGVTRDQAEEFIHYFAPDADLTGAVGAMQRLDVPLDLIVIDSASEAIVAAGGEINSNDDGTRFGRALRRLAQVTQAAIFYIDHVTQDHEAGSGRSLGAGAKRRFLDGAAYETVLIKRFGPGRQGVANVLNTKDRHGGVVPHTIKHGKHDVAGQLCIDADTSGRIDTVSIRPPDDMPSDTTDRGDFRPTGYMERVSRWLELHPGEHSRNDIQDGVRGAKNHIDTALKRLHEEGYVERHAGSRGAQLHAHKTPYRELSDTHEIPRS
jgi:hypothetical protein